MVSARGCVNKQSVWPYEHKWIIATETLKIVIQPALSQCADNQIWTAGVDKTALLDYKVYGFVPEAQLKQVILTVWEHRRA